MNLNMMNKKKVLVTSISSILTLGMFVMFVSAPLLPNTEAKNYKKTIAAQLDLNWDGSDDLEESEAEAEEQEEKPE